MSKVYPISEIFTSPQGEGVFTGTLMTFVRLGGCTVGKPYPSDMYKERYSTDTEERPLHLPIYTEKCTLYDGREFPCDTDYRVKERLTAKQIKDRIECEHVCITGGEPLMHDLRELLNLFRTGTVKIHLETSGTQLSNWMTEQVMKFQLKNVWVTVSPKANLLNAMVQRADEFKILVDENFNPDTALDTEGPSYDLRVIARMKPTYLQPVNFEHAVNADNVKLCLKWQNMYPEFRISLQLHKVLSLFTEERVK